MSQADREKWDQRYRDGAYRTRTHPTVFLHEWLAQLDIDSSEARTLDIACGTGRNALFLAHAGWYVDAIDISTAGLDRLRRAAQAHGLPVRCIEADLEDPLNLQAALNDTARYDLAIMMRYTNLPLVAVLSERVRAGGYVIVEEHLRTQAEVTGPRNPRFRVAPGALRAAAAGLEVIEYREGLVTDPDGRVAALAQLVARKPIVSDQV